MRTTTIAIIAGCFIAAFLGGAMAKPAKRLTKQPAGKFVREPAYVGTVETPTAKRELPNAG